MYKNRMYKNSDQDFIVYSKVVFIGAPDPYDMGKVETGITPNIDAEKRRTRLEKKKKRLGETYRKTASMFCIKNIEDYKKQLALLKAQSAIDSLSSPESGGEKNLSLILANYMEKEKAMFYKLIQLDEKVREKYSKKMTGFLLGEVNTIRGITDPNELKRVLRKSEKRFEKKLEDVKQGIDKDLRRKLYIEYLESDEFEKAMFEELEEIRDNVDPDHDLESDDVVDLKDHIISNMRIKFISQIEHDTEMSSYKYPIEKKGDIYEVSPANPIVGQFKHDSKILIEEEFQTLLPEEVDAPRTSPTISKVSLKTDGTLIIEGADLGIENRFTINLGNITIYTFSVAESDVSANGLKLNKVDEIIKRGISSALPENIKKEVVDKISSDDISEFLEAYKSKPTLVFSGTASLEGPLSSNLRIAEMRAEKAKQAFIQNNPEAANRFDIKVETYVQGLDGKKIRNEKDLSLAENELVKKWNEEFENDTANDAKYIYKKLKNNANLPSDQKAFLKEHFVNARAARVTINPPNKDRSMQLAVTYENETPSNATA